jgi:CBS domain-containing protein
MLVRDVMTSPAITIGPGDSVAEVSGLLDRLSLTSLPVVDENGRLVGVIDEFDVIGQLITWTESRSTAPGQSGLSQVRDVMTRGVLTIAADDDVAEFVAIMSGTTLKSLPVLLDGRVAGVISRRDVIRAVAHGDLALRSTADTPTV